MKIKIWEKIKYLPDILVAGVFGGWVYSFIGSDFLNSILFVIMLGPAIASRIIIRGELKPKYVCPSCKNTENEYFQGSYCKECGTKLVKVGNELEYFCDFCHRKISPKDDFCMYCGKKQKRSN